MTITQRIELRRLGYTKEEIAELAELEKTPDPVPEQPETPDLVPEQPETPAPVPEAKDDINAQLLFAINNLTSVLQNQKLNQTAQPEVKQETVEDIFNNILKG